MNKTVTNHYPLVTAMIQYLSPEYGMGLRTQIQAELAELLGQINHQPNILEALLSSPAHIPLEMLKIYLDNVGYQVLDQMTDFDDDPVSPFRLAPFQRASPAERQELIRILAGHTDEPMRAHTATEMVRCAIRDNDHKFLDWLESRSDINQQIIFDAVGQKSPLEEDNPSTALPMVDRLFEYFSPEALPESDFCAITIQRNNIRTTAILMARGWDPQKVLENICSSHDGGNWSNRLLARLSASNHKKLEILSTLPSPEDLLNMSRQEVKLLLAGPSAREQKKMAREKKRAESRQYFIDRNLPLPEGLKNES